MSSKRFNIKPNTRVLPCPKCGNNTKFTARSEQVAEDCCDMWVECICGHDLKDHREDVWGALNTESIWVLLFDWNDTIRNAVKA